MQNESVKRLISNDYLKTEINVVIKYFRHSKTKNPKYLETLKQKNPTLYKLKQKYWQQMHVQSLLNKL